MERMTVASMMPVACTEDFCEYLVRNLRDVEHMMYEARNKRGRCYVFNTECTPDIRRCWMDDTMIAFEWGGDPLIFHTIEPYGWAADFSSSQEILEAALNAELKELYP